MTTTKPERGVAEKPQRPKRCGSCAHRRDQDPYKGMCRKVGEGLTVRCNTPLPHIKHFIPSPDFGCIYWEK